MRSQFLAALLFFLCGCAGEMPQEKVETTEAADTRVLTPQAFKDIVVNAFSEGEFSLLQKIVPQKSDIVESLQVKDSASTDPRKKMQFEAFTDNVTQLVRSKAQQSFEQVLREGQEYGIKWDTSAAKLQLEKTSGKNFPGYYITVIYQVPAGTYHLKMQADSLSRGFLLGNKFALLKEEL